ncbi:short-chain dehydrogenase/reductase SDR [Desarmillaria tabescens]|uniref:Short-chain dehydrogenase/reductase SDR n=1 Tax=Armillaria tabescens TaxID=1929756 RepID=A0AA39NLD6_ARMTA|nr:short-chain dehydrogenase/reductase SDR [Desarmillaria tabescens]KAK0467784.1 short-chain dehydrogenase/reductase SDR [Desarmillaria tabescens]
MLGLQGIALVTGAARGIGRATAVAFARAGVSGIHLTDVRSTLLEDTAKDTVSVATNPNFRVFTSVVDTTKEDQVVQMVNDTIKTFGRVDYAANIAGVVDISSVTTDVTMAEYDRVNNVNARGVFMCMREELRAMIKQEPVVHIPGRPAIRGAITNLGSAAGQLAVPGMNSYIASKHAVVGMTKAAALNHATDAVRVNVVCPGFVDTEMLVNVGDMVYSDRIREAIPMKRLAYPEEIADHVLFSASQLSSYMTGHAWIMDGGYSLA